MEREMPATTRPNSAKIARAPSQSREMMKIMVSTAQRMDADAQVAVASGRGPGVDGAVGGFCCAEIWGDPESGDGMGNKSTKAEREEQEHWADMSQCGCGSWALAGWAAPLSLGLICMRAPSTTPSLAEWLALPAG